MAHSLRIRFWARPKTTFFCPLEYFGESIVVVVGGRFYFVYLIALDLDNRSYFFLEADWDFGID